MMIKHYCACCNKPISASKKDCPHCGSHYTRSPYSLGLFCLIGCLAVIMVFKTFHFYTQNHESDLPKQQNILEVFNMPDTATHK